MICIPTSTPSLINCKATTKLRWRVDTEWLYLAIMRKLQLYPVTPVAWLWFPRGIHTYIVTVFWPKQSKKENHGEIPVRGESATKLSIKTVSIFSLIWRSPVFAINFCSFLQTNIPTFSRQTAASETFRLSLGTSLSSGASVKRFLSKKQLLILVQYNNSMLPHQVRSCKKMNFSGLDHLTIASIWIIQSTKWSKCKQRIKQQAVHSAARPEAAPVQPKGVTAACWWLWLTDACWLLVKRVGGCPGRHFHVSECMAFYPGSLAFS